MPGVTPIHLKPATELAERVLLPGDPHRALAVAQVLLEQPKMFNHHRGLWGYTGVARDGELLTVQATGMGGPSAAIVFHELVALGARTFIRIGTCGAIGDDGLAIGDVVAVERALAEDGTSAALGANGEVMPDAILTDALREACGGRAVTAVSTDLFYDDRDGPVADWVERGASAVEMEAATLFQAARVNRVLAACVLGVTDIVGQERLEISDGMTDAALLDARSHDVNGSETLQPVVERVKAGGVDSVIVRQQDSHVSSMMRRGENGGRFRRSRNSTVWCVNKSWR